MDRRIEKKTWTGKRLAVLLGAVALAASVALLLQYLSTPRMRVERDKLTLDTVRRGTFQEYLLPEGTVLGEGGGLIVRATVDALEAPRLRIGQPGGIEAEATRHALEIFRIGEPGPRSAEVDLRFAGPTPAGIVPGQKVRLRINLGEPGEVLLLRRGGFFQETGGQWVFLVDEAKGTAARRTVRLGRQNLEEHEVLSGLAEGDRVIISTYSHLGEAEELVLTGE